MIKNCKICNNEFISNTNQICCSEECKRRYKKEYFKKYRQEHKEHYKEIEKNYNQIPEIKEQHKIYNREYQQGYRQTDKSKKYRNEWNENNKDYNKNYYQNHKEEIKEYRQTPKVKQHDKEYRYNYYYTINGRLAINRRNNKRYRSYGFNPLNEYFKESEAHHINEINVIYIPKELHKSVYHDLRKNINMNEINLLAWNFLESNSY